MKWLSSLGLFLLLAGTAFSQPPTIDELAAKLPRVPGKSPSESAAAIVTHPDFEVQLVAAEPLVRDPVAVDFDERGRMYVVELPEYNGYAVEDFDATGSIRLLEDKDHDGHFETSIVFADGLRYPTAVACWDGGVFVGAAPDLLYLKDTNGDGRADSSQVVFTGFGTDKAGEAHLNSFRWGFDNRIHFSTNLSGGDIRTPQAEKGVSVRGRGMVFDPRDWTRFELTSGGGQHGLSMDDWGRKFVCANSVPAQTLIYDDRYLARNPFVQASAAAVNIAPDGKHTRLFRISPEEPWRALRTELRSTGRFRGSDEGGKPFGFFTGATGITIYRGDAWPEEYRGNLLVGDVANNLIYRANLSSQGVSLIASRADADQEFLASRDIWFRPVQMANAPDGSLFVLDIYRELIEGAAFLPPEFLKYLDPVSGNDRGRIYRIAPRGFNPSQVPTDLSSHTPAELVPLLAHTNGWHRDTASRLLYQRQDRSVAPALRELAKQSPQSLGRMTALHTLHGLRNLTAEDVLIGLQDDDPRVVVQALRLAEHFPDDALLLERMQQLTKHEDRQVRYQLSFSIGNMNVRRRAAIVAPLAFRDSHDPWFRMALQSSLVAGASEVFQTLIRDGKYVQSEHGQTFLLSLASQIASQGRKDELVAIMHVLPQLNEDHRVFSERLLEVVLSKQTGPTREAFLAASQGRASEMLAEMLAIARRQAVDPETALAKRVEAIESLRLAKFSEIKPLLADLLNLNQPAEIQSAALRTLAAYSDQAVADVILASWRAFSPGVRAEAAETLLSRAPWVTAFLDAVEERIVRPSDLPSARIELLKKHPDARLAERAQRLFASSTVSQRDTVIKAYQPALTMKGSPEAGKAVFKKSCSACHRLEGIGTQVGEDLTAIRNRGMAAVLLNVLDPNREVKPQFHTYVANTVDGRVITGMIQEETANSLTFRRADATTVVVPRQEIDDLQSTGLSFMPEGLEKQVNLQQMADLLRYLESIR